MSKYQSYVEGFNRTQMAQYLWDLIGRAFKSNHPKFMPIVVKRYNRELMRYSVGR